MAMNIVFCADGTWNNPNQDSDGDDVPDPTNVYKLFLCLDGVDSPGALLTANEQEKRTGKQWANVADLEVYSRRRRFAEPHRADHWRRLWSRNNFPDRSRLYVHIAKL